MAAKNALRNISGVINEFIATVISAGAANAGDFVGLDGTGRLDNSVMPVGIGADTASIAASEALTAGQYVNVWNNAGVFNVRKADATVVGKEAMGFVLTGVASGANALVYFEGTNNQVTGQTPGKVFLQTTAGTGGATVPSATGNVVQTLGFAISATAVNFQSEPPITLA